MRWAPKTIGTVYSLWAIYHPSMKMTGPSVVDLECPQAGVTHTHSHTHSLTHSLTHTLTHTSMTVALPNANTGPDQPPLGAN